MDPDRRIMPDVLANTRDCGGLPTEDGRPLRRGRLLRTAAMTGLTPAAADRLTRLLGPAHYVDLRTEREVDRDGMPQELIRRGWTWHPMPLEDQPPGRDGVRAGDPARVTALLPELARAAARTARLAADRPAVIGCSLGKDRTGMVTALLLRWMGVARAEIVADHLYSDACLASGRHLLPPRWSAPHGAFSPASERSCGQVLDAADALGPVALPRPPALAHVRTSLLVEEG